MVKKISFKYSIGYNDNDDIRPLCIILPHILNALKVTRQCLSRLVITNVKKVHSNMEKS